MKIEKIEQYLEKYQKVQIFIQSRERKQRTHIVYARY